MIGLCITGEQFTSKSKQTTEEAFERDAPKETGEWPRYGGFSVINVYRLLASDFFRARIQLNCL